MITAGIKDYQQRVGMGKIQEVKVVNALRSRGVRIMDPTDQEDQNDKIDGWLLDRQNVRHSLQVKVRENGDDIIFEIKKNLDTDENGRDLISKAEYYLVVGQAGVAGLFLTKPIKQLAEHLLSLVKSDVIRQPDKTRWRGNYAGDWPWEAKITEDRAHGNRKLMAYLSPMIFKCMGRWKFDPMNLQKPPTELHPLNI